MEQTWNKTSRNVDISITLKGEEEIWTPAPLSRPIAFRVRPLQPLGYFSIINNSIFPFPQLLKIFSKIYKKLITYPQSYPHVHMFATKFCLWFPLYPLYIGQYPFFVIFLSYLVRLLYPQFYSTIQSYPKHL